jgi:hypothetical protein
MEIPRRISQAILSSLQAGVVPRVGLEYIAVGRKQEIGAVLEDMESVVQGGAAFRFIIGRYGSGKSFFLQAMRNHAMDRDFVVADADLSPDKRFSGAKGSGLATYRELLQRLSTKVRPDGGALEGMLQKWVSSVQSEVVASGYAPEDPAMPSRVEWLIGETVRRLEDYSHGFDFAAAVSLYYRGFSEGNEAKKGAALRWLRGEYATRSEAKQSFRKLGAQPVSEAVTDANWYDHLKLFAAFCTAIGYKGLLVFIDEGVNLFKISNRVSRENNYEKLLSVFNDIMQGKASKLGFYLAGTPQFLEDRRRGMASYPALKSRLEESRFVRSGHTDSGSPIIRLERLSNEEMFVLLERLTEIHAIHFGYEAALGEDELGAFLELALSSPGADEFITPREICRDFLSLLNILKDGEGDMKESFYDLVRREDMKVRGATPEELYANFEL